MLLLCTNQLIVPPDDGLSDDLAMEAPAAVSLPAAELGNLVEIESSMRLMTNTANGRDALSKAIMAEDYIGKLIPLVEMAEDLESLPDLHRLCNIMKAILLLNDTTIIEHAVSDECVLGVVGALEYDPDFPSHKANHRHWLDNQGRYKEVVPIEDEQTRQKIHQTYASSTSRMLFLPEYSTTPRFQCSTPSSSSTKLTLFNICSPTLLSWGNCSVSSAPVVAIREKGKRLCFLSSSAARSQKTFSHRLGRRYITTSLRTDCFKSYTLAYDTATLRSAWEPQI